MLNIVINQDNMVLNQDILNEFATIKDQAEKFFLKRESISPNFNFDISSSTYRIFRNTKNKPSIIVKDWIKSLLHNDEFFNDVEKINNRADFYNFHEKYAELLSEFWEEKEGNALSVAYKYKILDLFLKSLINHELHNDKINKKLEQYCNVPLDSITFYTLDKITFGKFKLKNKTTGYITNKQMYDNIQLSVEFICDKAKMPKIYFEYFSQQLKKSKIE